MRRLQSRGIDETEESHVDGTEQIFNIIIENSQTKEKHNHTDTQDTNKKKKRNSPWNIKLKH